MNQELSEAERAELKRLWKMSYAQLRQDTLHVIEKHRPSRAQVLEETIADLGKMGIRSRFEQAAIEALADARFKLVDDEIVMMKSHIDAILPDEERELTPELLASVERALNLRC